MLARFFPGRCSRLKIFLCHAHSDRAVAEEIAQALKNDGHIVFFDKDSLPAASDYNEQIRAAIHEADRFIFLISRNALAEGKYTLSELAFARERWPNAQGVIYPVLIDKCAAIESVPAYLRSVHILQIEGNAPVEVAAALEKSRTLHASCVLGAAGAALGLVVAGLLAFQTGSFLLPSADFEILKPEQVDFRPMMRPAAGSAWLDSPVAITLMPVHYSNTSGRPVRVLQETVALEMADQSWRFRWFNEVSLNPQTTEKDWLGFKKGAGAETLEAGHTLQRETMYVVDGAAKLTWRAFLERMFDPATQEMKVVLTSRSESTLLGQSQSATKEVVCLVDAADLRAGLAASGFKPGVAPHPPRASPLCK